GSICLMGFKLKRPLKRAVWSPNQEATQPCATSCKVMANKMGMAQITIFCMMLSSMITTGGYLKVVDFLDKSNLASYVTVCIIKQFKQKKKGAYGASSSQKIALR